MNKVLLQIWEESQIVDGCCSDGCSLHLSEQDLINFNSVLHSSRDLLVSDTFERVIGLPIEVCVTNKIYQILQSQKNVRLQQHEMNNLLSLKEITVL